MASKFRYFCRKCGFQMNALHRPLRCPTCSYVEPMKSQISEATLQGPRQEQQPITGLQFNTTPQGQSEAT